MHRLRWGFGQYVFCWRQNKQWVMVCGWGRGGGGVEWVIPEHERWRGEKEVKGQVKWGWKDFGYDTGRERGNGTSIRKRGSSGDWRVGEERALQ